VKKTSNAMEKVLTTIAVKLPVSTDTFKLKPGDTSAHMPSTTTSASSHGGRFPEEEFLKK